MPEELIVGEFRRTIDDRFRVSIPGELLTPLGVDADGLLAKERPGALSLWPLEPWQSQFADGIRLIEQRIQTGRLSERIAEVQLLGRLLSTRQRKVPIAGRGRLVIPEGFREFLGAEPGSDVLLVGAAVCIEIWRPEAWRHQLEEQIPRFRELYDDLSR